jgi:hypothetical protein
MKGKKMFLNIVKSILIVSLLTACGGSSDSSDENNDDGRSNLTDEENGNSNEENNQDTTAPVIKILGKNPTTVVQNSTYKDAGATAKDSVDGVVTVKSGGSVNTSVIKSYIITYTATDKAGNTATTRRIVNVIKKIVVADITAPVIALIGDNPASVVQNSTYTDAGATAKDNIDGIVTVKSTGSVDTSTLGDYTITYTATDKAGNKATKTRKVKVILPPDTIAPVIIISGDNPLEISQGETFSDPGATATDDRDEVITVTPSGTVDMSTVGDYNIVYTATDNAGNETNATRTVTVNPADVVWNVSNMTEFRQALEDASANGESDRIVLSKGTYTVTSDGLGTLIFNDDEAFNLTIEALEGLTNKDVILDGNNSTKIFNFNNTQSSILILKNISVIDGNSTKDGAVYTNQNIKIQDCNISNNIAFEGGGFYSNGTTTVSDSTISHNSSTTTSYRFCGGGFYSAGTTTITNSTISQNNNNSYNGAGGFYSAGTTTITNSTISQNTSDSVGGFSSPYQITRITNSTVSNNKGFYGGFYAGSVIIHNSTISNNHARGDGGGFYAGHVTINSSIINNNHARGDGGGFYAIDGTIINSIFSENNATIGATYYSSDDSSAYNFYYSFYINNNIFVKNKGSIYSTGIFVNNVFSENDEDITLTGESKIYNNYIDYNKIENNGHNVIKKKNLQPSSVGEVYLTSKYALKSESPVIDKGLNPSSATYKKIIDNDTIYNKMLELLKTDMVGNKRIHNSTIDMGAVEYGSSK